MTDPAEIRAGMRRKLEAWHRGVDVGLVDYLTRHADVLLADPAPEPAEALTRVRTLMDAALEWTDSGGECADFITAALATLTTLADPAPVGLTEDERDLVEALRLGWGDSAAVESLLAIIDRLSAAPDDRERVPEGWRVEWIECRHYRPEESHPVPRLIEIVPSCEGHRRLVPVSPSVDPEEG